MKTSFFILLLSASSFLSSQSRAVTESWLVDKSMTKGKIYKVAVGKNIYESFAISLSLLVDELRSTEQEIQPDAPLIEKTSLSYSFGKTTIQHLRKNFKELISNNDSTVHSLSQALTIKIQYADGKRKAVIRYSDEGQEQSSHETFAPSKYFARENTTTTIDYDFQSMSFNDLLNELNVEGVEMHFFHQPSMTFALITYPLSKVRK